MQLLVESGKQREGAKPVLGADAIAGDGGNIPASAECFSLRDEEDLLTTDCNSAFHIRQHAQKPHKEKPREVFPLFYIEFW